MKSKEEIETLLEGFSNVWPDDGSIVKCVMGKIESTPVKTRKPFKLYFSKQNKYSIRKKYIFSRIGAMALGLIVVATFLWICVSGQNQHAFAQMIEKVQQTRSLTFKAKVEGDIDSEEQKWIV